jgi:thiosulfate dehydrogenase [quinone] large subunit
MSLTVDHRRLKMAARTTRQIGVRMSTTAEPESSAGGHVVLGRTEHARVSPAAANTAALLRIALGLVYLWAFVAQAFGIGYTDVETTADGKAEYGWHFSYDADKGWITSGFSHSPTAAYIDETHGPTAFIVQNLPTGIDDLGWMFAIGGLGIALVSGICARIAGIGGCALNLLIWFAAFPPSGNPLVDGTHTVYALVLLLLMFLHAGYRWGLGRWWEEHTPALLH